MTRAVDAPVMMCGSNHIKEPPAYILTGGGGSPPLDFLLLCAGPQAQVYRKDLFPDMDKPEGDNPIETPGPTSSKA